MEKKAANDHPIHELIRARWSPRAFNGIAVSEHDLCSILEAARWAPSAFNEQPWAYLVARRDDHEAFQHVLDCLVPANQTWARRAGALMLAVARDRFGHNDKLNTHAWHDLGLANAQLTLQATSLGLHVHFMAGFDAARAREAFSVPEGWTPVVAIAIGHLGSVGDLPDELREREGAVRTRHALGEFTHVRRWNERPSWVSGT